MSNNDSRPLLAFAIAAAVVWHVLMVLSPAWILVSRPNKGRDFASYYYAARVAVEGGDPYDRRQVNQSARADGVRAGVHPFFYPPPFVLGSAWVTTLDLGGAYQVWFWLDEAMALLAGLALFFWWRELSPLTGAVIAVLLALMTAVPNNHVMGQANLVVLALLLGGLWLEDREKPVWAGVLVGLACMAKMSPALFVAWWVLRRRWVAAGAACATAVVASVLSLAVVGFDEQMRFYTQVLPKFASGDYNGLAIPLDLFGNHSVPNVLHQLFPSGGRTLSATARVGSTVFTLGLLTGLGLAFGVRRPAEDRWNVSAQAAAVGVAMLLVPVYTYEHHLVWALPAAVLAILAASTGRLPLSLVVLAGASVVVLCFDLQALKQWHVRTPTWAGSKAIQELKFLGLCGLLLCNVWLGRAPPRS